MTSLCRSFVMVSVFGLALAATAPGAAANEADVTYYQDVLPIIQNNCQNCHRPEGLNLGGVIAPMSFMSYEETRPWARSIKLKVEAHEMPPWYASAPKGVFSNERGLTEDEIGTLARWVAAGAPLPRPRAAAGRAGLRTTCSNSTNRISSRTTCTT